MLSKNKVRMWRVNTVYWLDKESTISFDYFQHEVWLWGPLGLSWVLLEGPGAPCRALSKGLGGKRHHGMQTQTGDAPSRPTANLWVSCDRFWEHKVRVCSQLCENSSTQAQYKGVYVQFCDQPNRDTWGHISVKLREWKQKTPAVQREK